MEHGFENGQAVRVIRNVRNDGTYPGMKTGDLLVRRGSVGYVRDKGTFLQDQVIYSVHFLDIGKIVGCREQELIDAEAPWIPSRFEFREKVMSRCPLSVSGEIVVGAGEVGEVVKVLREDDGVAYHVLFPSGRVFLLPESTLTETVPAEAQAQ